MTTLDTGITILRSAAGRVSAAHSLMGRRFKSVMPTGLYARTLLIMIVTCRPDRTLSSAPGELSLTR